MRHAGYTHRPHDRTWTDLVLKKEYNFVERKSSGQQTVHLLHSSPYTYRNLFNIYIFRTQLQYVFCITCKVYPRVGHRFSRACGHTVEYKQCDTQHLRYSLDIQMIHNLFVEYENRIHTHAEALKSGAGFTTSDTIRN